MNQSSPLTTFLQAAYRVALASRWLGRAPVCQLFGVSENSTLNKIERIYVINLDRQTLKWTRVRRELSRIRSAKRRPLSEIATRISAIDARDNLPLDSDIVIVPHYTLADQLYVEPQPAVPIGRINVRQPIQMTRQEIAVSLSHIEAWKRIAHGSSDYSLVMEDDAVFKREFPRYADKAWADLIAACHHSEPFDLFYFSYQEVKGGAEKSDVTDYVFRPFRGLWHLSGYVLSRSGAHKLLALLPIRGPVDLWINHQFDKLNVYAASKPLIVQRLDSTSDNLYSILPELTKIGLLENVKPLHYEKRRLRRPVFAFGNPLTGLTSLAMALSMLGYRCCSDVSDIPVGEYKKLREGKADPVFDAYVNVGGLRDKLFEINSIYRGARFIATVSSQARFTKAERNVLDNRPFYGEATDSELIAKEVQKLRENGASVLILPNDAPDRWMRVCEFLECSPPTCEYPVLKDRSTRQAGMVPLGGRTNRLPRVRRLKFDRAPWIVPFRKNWAGIPTVETTEHEAHIITSESVRQSRSELGEEAWIFRDDTFPSNLALFRPSNVSVDDGSVAALKLRKENLGVRGYSAAAISSRKSFLYGQFEVATIASRANGVVTGMFLHRNSPRQEIDIELVGKNTRKVLLNVYYNPGTEGARFEYGYRGTPVEIDLGFDASEDFHRYRVEWSPTQIEWFVDDALIYQRVNWDPTPIPHLPMQFHVNIWPSRSVELAGRLSPNDLPTQSVVKDICLRPRPKTGRNTLVSERTRSMV